MIDRLTPTDKFLIPLSPSVDSFPLPQRFNLNHIPHPLAVIAAKDLQKYLQTQNDWVHNFGLIPGQKGKVVGKMFGVLVVRTLQNDMGYIAAFSGKLANSNQHMKFVPPVFDGLCNQSFVNQGMRELSRINLTIKDLEVTIPAGYDDQIRLLKSRRKKHSISLQQKIFDQYFFLNQLGEKKSLNEIFKKASYKNPPSGAGECAGPKLLQYAFQNQMRPIALTEFWWGLSPKSNQWKHGDYYLCCKEKCQPILDHMLEGLV
ncbi:hypothetical protein [Daejeonella sp.]|uniref:hypothetical protein n=1 Tax=Daejeonella sp. TaxID=2805397 RepID=UPI003983713E